MKFDRSEDFHLIFNLQKKQPWLVKKVEALHSLLFTECPTDAHRKLVVELIDRFCYFSNRDYSTLLEKLVADIKDDIELSDGSTQLVSMAADSDADSSQYLLYSLKPMLEDLGWRDYVRVNKFSHAFRAYGRSNAHKDIVLIDEFLGSGNTAINRVRNIRSTFSNAGIEDYSVRVKVLIATEKGIEAVRAAGIDSSTIISLPRGITDYYESSIVETMISLMRDLESILLQSYKDTDLPSLGFGCAESLYCREEGNTPNNVFPIFWWPFYLNSDERSTLLTRAMGDV